MSGRETIAVRGAVVDTGFDAGDLPQINEELVVERDRPDSPIVEVQAHLDDTTVCGVALQATAGRAGAGDRRLITIPADAVQGLLFWVAFST